MLDFLKQFNEFMFIQHNILCRETNRGAGADSVTSRGVAPANSHFQHSAAVIHVLMISLQAYLSTEYLLTCGEHFIHDMMSNTKNAGKYSSHRITASLSHFR